MRAWDALERRKHVSAMHCSSSHASSSLMTAGGKEQPAALVHSFFVSCSVETLERSAAGASKEFFVCLRGWGRHTAMDGPTNQSLMHAHTYTHAHTHTHTPTHAHAHAHAHAVNEASHLKPGRCILPVPRDRCDGGCHDESGHDHDGQRAAVSTAAAAAAVAVVVQPQSAWQGRWWWFN